LDFLGILELENCPRDSSAMPSVSKIVAQEIANGQIERQTDGQPTCAIPQYVWYKKDIIK